MKDTLKATILVLMIFIISENSSAQCIIATSCSNEAVQAAIDQAGDKDTVIIPSGECTWTSTVKIPSSKNLTILGSGGKNTIISSNIPGATIDVENTTGTRITQIGFKLENDIGTGIYVSGTNWRVDHCQFDFLGVTDYTIEGVYAIGDGINHPVGVVDHCLFNNIRIYIMGQGKEMANEVWHEPLGLGTNNAIFVEDNIMIRTFGNRNSIDSHSGGRYVFRYNKVTNGQAMAHSVNDDNRASRSWEIYENTFHGDISNLWCPFFLRGGTGVVFNNKVTGKWTQKLVIENERSWEPNGPGGIADGSSVWDGNLPVENGTGTHTGSNNDTVLTDNTKSWNADGMVGIYIYNITDGSSGHIRSNDGTSLHVTLSGGADNDWDTGDKYKITNGYYARDQIGRSTDEWLWEDTDIDNDYNDESVPPQELDPMYQWNNVYQKDSASSIDTLIVYIHNNSDNHIKEGRDYYDKMVRPGYTPYTYPHPLVTEQDGTGSKETSIIRSLKIYPIPASDFIFLLKLDHASFQSQFTGHLCNINGTLIKTFEINDNETKIDMNNFSAGVYYIMIVNRAPGLDRMQQSMSTFKIIKK